MPKEIFKESRMIRLKKVLLILVFLIVGVAGLVAFSGCEKENDPEDFVFDSDTGEIVDYVGERTDVIIPEKLYDEVVKSIRSNAFKDKGIESVKLPKKLEVIGTYAFKGNKIKELEIPDSVRDIGASAFADNAIEELEIGRGIGTIAAYTFYNNDIRRLEIPANVQQIGVKAFSNNENISSVKILGDNPKRFNVSWSGAGLPENLKPE